MEERTTVTEEAGGWLRELAINNSVLTTLNLYKYDVYLKSPWEDLELIAQNCRSLISLSISKCDISYLVGGFLFRTATALEEFAGGSFDDQTGETNMYNKICFPARLCNLGLSCMGTNEMHIVFPFAALLKNTRPAMYTQLCNNRRESFGVLLINFLFCCLNDELVKLVQRDVLFILTWNFLVPARHLLKTVNGNSSESAWNQSPLKERPNVCLKESRESTCVCSHSQST